MLKLVKRIILIFLGTVIMATGAFFFNFPSKIAAGGVGGTALVLNSLFPFLPIGTTVTVLNITLFLIGFLVLGKEFGIFTFLGMISYSLCLVVLEKIFEVRQPIVNDMIVNLIVGATFIGVGLAIVFQQNASTGGTDVIIKILDRFTKLGLGKSIFLADSSVIVFATMVFGIEKGIYAILSLLVTTLALDKVISGFNTKYSLTIISEKMEEINEYIIKNLDRGTTIYKAYGGYTRGERNILVTIVDRQQLIKIKNFVNKIDDNAFVFVNHTSEVIGEGFTRGLKDV